MLLVVTALALLVTVPLAGGRLGRLAEIRPRAVWAVLLAAAIQVAITQASGRKPCAPCRPARVLLRARRVLPVRQPAPGRGPAGGARRRPERAAITTNGGVMPASAAALRISGIASRPGFDNSAALAHPHLGFLGDVIPVPGPVADRQRAERRRPDHLRRRLRRAARRLRFAPVGTASAPQERQNLARCARFDCRNLIFRSRRRRSWPAWPRSSSCPFEELPRPPAGEDPATGWTREPLARRPGARARPHRRPRIVHLAGSVDRPRRGPVRGHVRRAVGRRLGSGRRLRAGPGGDRGGVPGRGRDIALAMPPRPTAPAERRDGRDDRGRARPPVSRRGCCTARGRSPARVSTATDMWRARARFPRDCPAAR